MTNDPSSQAIRNIVIVGGGSAGWIVAGLLAGEHGCGEDRDITVTLIESPQVKTIGVGEGTWPTMRATLQRIGLSETDFLTNCSAAFKQGTRFKGWVTGAAGDVYYHPFTAPAGYGRINLVPYWQSQRAQVSFANAVCAQGHVCDRNLAPKQANTPEFAAVVNYAYHLDAGRFADLLRDHCTSTLGVRHIIDHVSDIKGSPDTDIEAVVTEQNGEIEGDLFVDCSGFSSLLLGKHFRIPYRDRRDVLFNDSALAVQVPYSGDATPIASQTISVAQGAGWIWDIGLVHRRGLGHVYSSDHTCDEAAAQALRRYIDRTAGLASEDYELRKITFRPGHRESFWHRNCVAVGMSAGFLEPLEASALVLVELAGRMIAEDLPAVRGVMDTVARRFNEQFRYRWDRIVDFLKLHYVLSDRSDSDYWADNRREQSIPDSLREALALWTYQVPWLRDFPQIEEVFSAASYQYVLYGMGFETRTRFTARQRAREPEAHRLFAENTRKTNQLIANLPDHRALLTRIAQSGLPAAANL